jgi:hypothetical protein
MRRTTVSALAVVILGVLAFVAVGLAVGPDGPAAIDAGSAGDAADPDDGPPSPSLVTVGDAELWPYVAPSRSFDRRASSINVVVGAGPDRVRRHLLREEAWNRTEETDEVVVGEGVNGSATDETSEDEDGESTDGTQGEVTDGNQSEATGEPELDAPLDDEVVPWRDAPGGTRYAYAADEGWTAEAYQLHRGTYFGSRYHLRAYGIRDGEWTAIQAHAEHWDWFTITHTVDSVEQAQRRVEGGFLGKSAIEVRRVYHGNGDTYDADGWTTVVLVALAPLLSRRLPRNLARRFGRVVTRQNRRRAALAGSLAALPLVVRFGGIVFERHLAWLSADAVVAVWYPVLVVGVPLVAYRFGRGLAKLAAGTLAALGFGTGLVLDYAYLGIGVLPIPVAVHRVVVVVAVGLVAAGAGSKSDDCGLSKSAFRWTPALRAGAVLWVIAVIAGHLV